MSAEIGDEMHEHLSACDKTKTAAEQIKLVRYTEGNGPVYEATDGKCFLWFSHAEEHQLNINQSKARVMGWVRERLAK